MHIRMEVPVTSQNRHSGLCFAFNPTRAVVKRLSAFSNPLRLFHTHLANGVDRSQPTFIAFLTTLAPVFIKQDPHHCTCRPAQLALAKNPNYLRSSPALSGRVRPSPAPAFIRRPDVSYGSKSAPVHNYAAGGQLPVTASTNPIAYSRHDADLRLRVPSIGCLSTPRGLFLLHRLNHRAHSQSAPNRTFGPR